MKAIKKLACKAQSVYKCEKTVEFFRQWLHYVSFFVPEEALYNAALSTYDLVLAVQVGFILELLTKRIFQVAEVSNRDPKEYLPILNEIQKV